MSIRWSQGRRRLHASNVGAASTPRLVWLLVCILIINATVNASAQTKTRVVVAQDPESIQHFDVNPEHLKRLVDRGILGLTGEKKLADAWRQFAGPRDVVGIKIVARGGPLFSVHKDLVDAIVNGLIAAGVPEHNIIVWDKYQSDLIEAGYKINDSPHGVRVMGVIPGSGFDPEVIYRSRYAGKIIWGDLTFGRGEEVSGESHVARIVTRHVTKLINVSILCDDIEVGLSGCLLNLALGSVDNMRRFQIDAVACRAAIPEICSMTALQDKTVLHIIDGVLGQYALGPTFYPQFTWHNGAVYFSTDPVALDTIALQEIESQRRRNSLQPIGKNAQYIQTAGTVGLGTADPKKIEVIRLGPK